MKEMDLASIHEKTFELFQEFHKVCVEHHLRYYMIGGTMLGAYRGKDFIPWDDDVDIAMPRKDYDKLMALRSTTQSDIMEIDYPDHEGYPWRYSRVFHKGTTLIQGMYNYLGGVFMDLYPLDGRGNNPVEQFLCSFRFRFYLQVIERVSKTSRIQTAKKGFFYSLAKRDTFLGWIRRMEDSLRRQSRKRNRYVSNYYGIYRQKEIFPAKVFGKPKLYEFHGAKFYGVADPVYYLTQLYGPDFMTPPAKNQRSNTRHSFKYIDLEHSYLDYKGGK